MPSLLNRALRAQPGKGNFASEWFAGVSPEEKKDLEAFLRNNTRTFELLRALIEKRYAAATTPLSSQYTDIGWPFLAAHRNGRIEELEYIYKLITPTEEQSE